MDAGTNGTQSWPWSGVRTHPEGRQAVLMAVSLAAEGLNCNGSVDEGEESCDE